MCLWHYTALSWALAALFQFLGSFYTVGKTPWTEDQPVSRPLPAHRTAQTQNKRTQTSMPKVGFEPTISVFLAPEDSSCLRRRGHCDGQKWMYTFTILVLGTGWRLVVRFTPRLLYPRGKNSQYPLVRRLGGPQNRSGHCNKERNLLLL
jgi:hypothetical protein